MYSALNKFFDLFPPLLIGLAVDIVVERESSFLGRIIGLEVFTQLLLVAFLTVLVWVSESVFEYLFVKKWKYLAQDYQNFLRLEAYDHYQKLDHTFLEGQRTGNLMAIINDDVNQLENFLNIGINQIIQITITVVCIGAYFFYTNFILATFAFCVIPFIVFGSIWYQRFLEKRYIKVRNEAGILNSELNNNILGISTIKAFTQEKAEKKRIANISSSYLYANEDAIKFSALFTPLIRMLIMIAFLVTMLYGGYLTINNQMEVGTYSVLVFLTQRLLWPLTGLGNTLDLYKKSMASFDRIQNLLKTPINITHGSITKWSEEVKKVSLENINFKYKSSDKQTLSNISFEILKGETLALVGATGSGKSTISKLMLRFYEPTSGNIKINDTEISNFNLQTLRNLISWVSQDVYLFHDTVKNNLLYGNPEIDQEKFDLALSISTAGEFISMLPNGLETMIGERGENLSGGQKQRLSIARAIISDRPILILDEATSAIDNVTSAKIQKNLENYLDHKISITIAHRLSSVINADKIVVLDHGQIIETGSHEQLLESKGKYSNLWNIQSGITR